MDIRFRRMTPADTPFGMELKTFAGWNQVEADWRAYLAYEPEGCFVAEADGRPAGTVTTIRYAGRIGWIGMLLVHPDLRRRGIGTALLERAIDHLRRCGIPCIKLDATPAGRAVYTKRGFRDEYGIERRQGGGAALAAPDLDPIRARDLAGITALDAAAFGVPRDRVIRRIATENPGRGFVARDPRGRPAGYILARPGSKAFQIGPWVAEDPRVAEDLLRRALSEFEGESVFLDIPLANPHAVELARAHGFEVQRPLTRMVRGPNDRPGDPARIFATSGPEKG